MCRSRETLGLIHYLPRRIRRPKGRPLGSQTELRTRLVKTLRLLGRWMHLLASHLKWRERRTQTRCVVHRPLLIPPRWIGRDRKRIEREKRINPPHNRLGPLGLGSTLGNRDLGGGRSNPSRVLRSHLHSRVGKRSRSGRERIRLHVGRKRRSNCNSTQGLLRIVLRNRKTNW